MTKKKIETVKSEKSIVVQDRNTAYFFPNHITSNIASFLKNGNLIDINFQISLNGFAVLNTCGFDSFSEIINTAYGTNMGFKNFIDAQKTNVQKDLDYLDFITLYHKQGPSAEVYRLRALILRSIFESRYSRKNKTVNCDSNVFDEVIPMILNSSFDSTQLHVCESGCRDEYGRKSIPINFADARFTKGNLKNTLETAIAIFQGNQGGSQTYRSHCPKTSSHIRHYTGTISQHYLSFSTYSEFKFSISIIPHTLTVNNLTYQVVGVVSHTPGHFKAYIKASENEWLIKDDMTENIKYIPFDSLKSTEAEITVLIYVR